MNRLNKSICGWQTVLIGLLVAPVFILNAELFQPPQHDSNLIYPIQFPQHILFHQHQQQQQRTNNAKYLETLNSRKILSSNDDLMHINAEKPVDAIHKMHRIEQLQQKHESTIYSDQEDAKNKNKFFDEDGSEMRPHGQPGNVLSRQFMIGNAELRSSGHKRKIAKPRSFAQQLINNLAAVNPVVNFSQSSSPNFWLPFNPQGTIYSVGNIRTSKNENNSKSVFPQSHVIIVNGPTRIYGAGTESKFPPFLEFFVQRIQKYFSVYKYEDLSRPALPSQLTTDVDENVGDDNQESETETITTPVV